MCGIAGGLTLSRRDGPLQIERYVELMNVAQAHRGPDATGIRARRVDDAWVVLGHRRLSILDVSERGAQPMVDAASGVALVYNGEAYNFRDLRTELLALGHTFQSESDTEVALQAYLEWGIDFLQRLRGMFALAILDPRRKVVVLARDRLGIKPLYYAVVQQAGHSAFLFASEVRSLLATGTVARRLDPAALRTYLWNGFVPGPHSIVEGVRLLPAASVLEIALASASARGVPVARHAGFTLHESRYWSLPRAQPTPVVSAQEICDRLETAVRIRLVSDVPLGVFLSGGVDSSVIAALAQRAHLSPIKTFNIRFNESAYDESRHARAIAKVLGTDHQEVTLSQAAFCSGLTDALGALDQPTFDGINTFFVSRAVRDAGLMVALAGTGGDELYGGYASFSELPRAQQWARRTRYVPRSVLDRVAKLVVRAKTGRPGAVLPQTRWGKLSDVLATSGDLLGTYQVAYSLFTQALQRQLLVAPPSSAAWDAPLLSGNGPASCGLDPELEAELRRLIAGQPALHAISLLELSLFLRERLLRDTDSASMAVSLEVRVPMIDHIVVEGLAGLDRERRFHPLGRKEFLREKILGHLDRRLFERPKSGFELPLAVWCQRQLNHEIDATLSDGDLCRQVGLNADVVARVWRAFRAGAPGMYWSRVWSLYTLLWWCRKHQMSA